MDRKETEIFSRIALGNGKKPGIRSCMGCCCTGCSD